MSRLRLEPPYFWMAVGIAVAILYGSFYPFNFVSRHLIHPYDPHGPVGVLLESGFRLGPRDDVVANLLLYAPFGFFAFYAIRARVVAAVALATVVGFGMSLAVELGQFYAAGRFQQISDLSANTVGMLAGALAAAVVRDLDFSPYVVLILTCWLGERCYPAEALPSRLELWRVFVGWLAAGPMLEDLCGETGGRVALALLLVGWIKVRTTMLGIGPLEIAAGTGAALLWVFMQWKVPGRTKVVAAVVAAFVIVEALAPFHLSPTASAFDWEPFRALLDAGTETAIRVFLAKAFLYGGLLWLLARAGMTVAASGALSVALVFCLSVAQTRLPGHSGEITDAVLVLMLTAMLKLVSLAQRPGPATFPTNNSGVDR